MRCPKCGYISFDHLELCLKCKKDISETSSQVEGTTFQGEALVFLKLQTESYSYDMEDDSSDEFDEIDNIEIEDPDLDVLVEDTGGIEFDGGDIEPMDDEEFTISMDDEEPEEEPEKDLDLEQFSDFEENIEESDDVQMSIPEELADMSDLSPPDALDEGMFEPPAATDPPLPEKDDDFDLDLDLDEFASDFSLSSPGEEEGEVANLSPEDIGDISPAQPEEPTTAFDDIMEDLDSDLDFELDLGDLVLPKEKK